MCSYHAVTVVLESCKCTAARLVYCSEQVMNSSILLCSVHNHRNFESVQVCVIDYCNMHRVNLAAPE